MKKILPTIIVSVLVLSGLGAVAISEENNVHDTISIEFSQPIMNIKADLISIDFIESNSFLMEKGKPLLPNYVTTFTYPFGTKIKDIKCTPLNQNILSISKDLALTPPTAISGQVNVESQIKSLLEKGEIYPSDWFNYDISTGMKNRERSTIVEIQINPIKYHSQDKAIEYIKKMNIDIHYELPNNNPLPRDEYELVVIGPSEFSDEIAPLITHKNNRGVTSRFVSLTDIYSGTYFPATGRDNPEKIKYFIKNAIDNWATENILLLGGSSYVPTRSTHIWIQEEYDQYGYSEVFISDLYYADIFNETGAFCSWDSNENDMFGEYNWEGRYDEVDLNPDVYLGRLACRNGGEVTTCVNKIKNYENTPGFLQDWFTNIVVVGGDSFPDNQEIDEGEYINQKVIDMFDGFLYKNLWVTNGKLTSVLPTGVAYIKSAISEGCSFVDFSGHGNTNIWATHPHGNHGIWVPTPTGRIYSSDVSSTSNGNMLPIVTVEACSTAKFADDPNCFNWAFIHNSNGGAIGTFGATGLGWGYVGAGVAQGLIGKLGLDTFRAFKLDESLTYGEMWANALDRFISPSMGNMEYKCVEEWQPLGDPTLAIAEESSTPIEPNPPEGDTNGNTKQEYTYTASTTDPDGDDLYYMFDWGDNTTSEWVGPYANGDTASADKAWNNDGTYFIRVVAKDEHGKVSGWSDPTEISMPKGKNVGFNSNIIFWLLEKFPNAFPILRYILG